MADSNTLHTAHTPKCATQNILAINTQSKTDSNHIYTHNTITFTYIPNHTRHALTTVRLHMNRLRDGRGHKGFNLWKEVSK